MVILTIVVEAQFSSSLHVQKCCSMHQRLSADLNSCIELRPDSDQGNKVNSSYEYDWHLPNDTKLLSSRDLEALASSSPVDIELNILQSNGSRELFLERYKNVFPLDERISLLDNGSLFLTNENLHTCIGTGLYPYWSYCLDAIFSIENSTETFERSFRLNSAVILQPCRTISRIQRCCPENKRLIQQRCQYVSKSVPNDWIHPLLSRNIGE
jgi:hypothetical protein